jgi:hypothetical protein
MNAGEVLERCPGLRFLRSGRIEPQLLQMIDERRLCLARLLGLHLDRDLEEIGSVGKTDREL